MKIQCLTFVSFIIKFNYLFFNFIYLFLFLMSLIVTVIIYVALLGIPFLYSLRALSKK
jgi:hypothetical protein